MSELSEESVKAEIRGWLEEYWDPNGNLLEWRNILSLIHISEPTRPY